MTRTLEEAALVAVAKAARAARVVAVPGSHSLEVGSGSEEAVLVRQVLNQLKTLGRLFLAAGKDWAVEQPPSKDVACGISYRAWIS